MRLQYKMQLLLVQRLRWIDHDQAIPTNMQTITHEIHEAPYDHLRSCHDEYLWARSPFALRRRWDGVYSQSTSAEIYIRREIAPVRQLITGGGGRGNTLSPAIAEGDGGTDGSLVQ
jgi:hypothetical protein